ncbi:MAG TPA: VWA domain-containing protein [Anaerolineales bacterium]|nr:VWA domain-containing protein [Anaerolineales bacterium]
MRKIFRFILTLSVLLVLVAGYSPAAFAQTPTPAPQIRITQVDNSKFPQVTVYVSVTDANGQPVGVDPSAIQISENGQVMKTTTASVASANGQTTKGPGPLTTLLVIDVSGSMATANKLAQAKAAAEAYVNQMRPGDQAGVIAFDTHVSVVQAITGDHQALNRAIDSLQSGTDTAMFDALASAEQLLGNVGGRKAILLLTDGMDNRSKSNEDAVIGAIGPSGLTISTIGLGNPQDVKSLQGIDEASLKSLAQRAGGLYTYEPDPSQLASIFQQYGNALQNEYALTYTSPSVLRDGVNRNLAVSLNGGAATVQSQYNPGGVLPEVASQNWMLFGGILVILLVLLAVPILINSGLRSFQGGKKKGRIKFAGQSTASSPQRGHVKLK